MAVGIFPSTVMGCVTPVCGDCGIALCIDIEESRYKKHKKFWDDWLCETCVRYHLQPMTQEEIDEYERQSLRY